MVFTHEPCKADVTLLAAIRWGGGGVAGGLGSMGLDGSAATGVLGAARDCCTSAAEAETMVGLVPRVTVGELTPEAEAGMCAFGPTAGTSSVSAAAKLLEATMRCQRHCLGLVCGIWLVLAASGLIQRISSGSPPAPSERGVH